MVECMNRAYLAGIIDGEGSIQLKGKQFAKLTLTIANTYKPLIDSLFLEFGGSLREYNGVGAVTCVKKPKTVYYWRLNGEKAESVLRECYPFLTVKKAHAEIIFSVRAQLHTIQQRISEEEHLRRKECFNRLRFLNQKGVPLVR